MVFATLYHKGSSLAFQISISQLRDPQFGTRAFLFGQDPPQKSQLIQEPKDPLQRARK